MAWYSGRLSDPSRSSGSWLEAGGGGVVVSNKLLYSSPNYSSPYLQSASPISQMSNSTGGPPHHHLISASSPHGGHRHPGQGWDLGYTGPAYSSGRFNAVAHSLQSTEVDLNESSVGTHV